MALVLIAEGGRRWVEKRLVGDEEFADEVSEENLAEGLVMVAKS